mmetsp:Transcript_22672/g.54256  ORF Transcript_22672/g.54256 Transcript_22672/m.54256 type:complete len:254 (+) Transcript_22672:1230-1991(+)
MGECSLPFSVGILDKLSLKERRPGIGLAPWAGWVASVLDLGACAPRVVARLLRWEDLHRALRLRSLRRDDAEHSSVSLKVCELLREARGAEAEGVLLHGNEANALRTPRVGHQLVAQLRLLLCDPTLDGLGVEIGELEAPPEAAARAVYLLDQLSPEGVCAPCLMDRHPGEKPDLHEVVDRSLELVVVVVEVLEDLEEPHGREAGGPVVRPRPSVDAVLVRVPLEEPDDGAAHDVLRHKALAVLVYVPNHRQP